MTQITHSAVENRPRIAVLGDLFIALQVTITFLFILLLFGITIGWVGLRFSLGDPLQSIGSPSISILVSYYLVILPIVATAVFISRLYYRVISLALFAVSAFFLAIAIPAAF